MYEQGTDVRLLTALLLRLENKTVVDAGAERGGFTEAFLDHGAEQVFAIEPYPPTVAALQERFFWRPLSGEDTGARSGRARRDGHAPPD